jgi:hypothetical protein
LDRLDDLYQELVQAKKSKKQEIEKEVLTYAVQYNKTLIRYSDNGRFIVPLDTNKLIIIPYTSQ